MEGEESSKTTHSLEDSNKNYLVGQFSMGGGIEVVINNNLRMLIEGNVVFVYNKYLIQ